jgi:hypothetical protein
MWANLHASLGAALLFAPTFAVAYDPLCVGDLDTFVNPARGSIVVAPDRSAATWKLGDDIARYRLEPSEPGVPPRILLPAASPGGLTIRSARGGREIGTCS